MSQLKLEQIIITFKHYFKVAFLKKEERRKIEKDCYVYVQQKDSNTKFEKNALKKELQTIKTIKTISNFEITLNNLNSK